MIDLITLTRNNIPENEVSQIVEHAKLQECTRGGKLYYETSLQQRNKEHTFIRIEANGKLKIECSIHKLYEQKTTGHYTNYGVFTLEQAKQTIMDALTEKGIATEDMRVYNYEIGVNLYMSQECRAYLDLMETIGILDDKKPLFINPRYKDRRVKTTVFHKYVRKYFKVYDKGFEARDKRRNDVPDQNILRLETVYRRVENMSLADFFSLENMAKMQDRFFKDWRTAQFKREIKAPKGTRSAKRDLCETILRVGTETALSKARERHKAGILTDKEFRGIREFIVNEWDNVKNNIVLAASDQEKEYREKLNQAKILLS